MADLLTIRNTLASVIQNNVTLPAAYNSQPLPAFGTLQGQVNPPCVMIAPQPGQSIKFDTLDGAISYHLRVIMLVPFTEDYSTQTLLDSFLSTHEAGSVVNAIDMNPRQPGVYDNVVVTTAHGYGERTWAGQNYFGCELLVTVMA